MEWELKWNGNWNGNQIEWEQHRNMNGMGMRIE